MSISTFWMRGNFFNRAAAHENIHRRGERGGFAVKDADVLEERDRIGRRGLRTSGQRERAKERSGKEVLGEPDFHECLPCVLLKMHQIIVTPFASQSRPRREVFVIGWIIRVAGISQ